MRILTMIELKSPTLTDPITDRAMFKVFLGGSIDMGKSTDWQKELVEKFNTDEYPYLMFLNPRRDDWDSTWVQDPTPGTKFHEQVTWEIDHQLYSHMNVYYFADGSASPITLLELGAFGLRPDSVVYSTENFYRHGNVKIHCARFDINHVSDINSIVEAITVAYTKYMNGSGLEDSSIS